MIKVNSTLKIPKYLFAILFDHLDFKSCKNLTKSFMQTLFRRYQINILKRVNDGFNTTDNFCKNGDLEVAKWLHKNYELFQGFIKFLSNIIVFEHAYENGHLNVVKWLHENYIINLSYANDNAFILASSNKHFEVVNGFVAKNLDTAIKEMKIIFHIRLTLIRSHFEAIN
jgi:hypothetical protein